MSRRAPTIDPLASATDCWEPEMRAWVDRHVAVLDGAAEDHAQRHERVPDRRRVAALGEQVVGDPLEVAALDVAQARAPDARDDVVAERRRVAPDRARLVDVAGAAPYTSGPHAGNELLGRLADGRVRRGAQRAWPHARLGLRAPRSRLAKGGEGVPDALGLARAPDARLVRRLAVAATAAPRCAGLLVPDLDSCKWLLLAGQSRSAPGRNRTSARGLGNRCSIH